jgi:2-desacetyl-2-hydroxyethyl bacteriochlorophyllide A dehydrogenase
MKALVKVEPGARRLEVRELPAPVPESDEVLLRVSECGICGTDVSVYEGSLSDNGDGGGSYPVVIGHEFTGVVVARGSAVASLVEGDWVVVNPHLYCGSCAACRRGEAEICENRPLLSWDRPGGAAEYVAVRASNAYRLDEGVSVRVGALAEPLAVSVHAVRRLAIRNDERLVVVGSGPIGILIGFVAVEIGIDVTLVGLEHDAARLAAARGLGVRTAMVQDARQAAPERGFDVVAEAAGSESALLDAISLARNGGRIGVLGLPHHPVSLEIPELVFGEKSLIGIRGYAPRDWERTAELLDAHASRLVSLITHDFGLGDIDKAMSAVRSRQAVKVVLRPGRDWHLSLDPNRYLLDPNADEGVSSQ